MKNRIMRKLLFFLTTFWIAVYSNARMPESVPSYNVVHLFPLPQVVRIAELALLCFLFVLAFTRKMQKHVFITALSTALFIILSLFNLLLRGNLLLQNIQDAYIRTAPYLFFVVIAQGERATSQELKRLVVFFSVTLGLSILIAVLYQIPLYGSHEDNIHGFYEDAHLFCNQLLLFAVVLIYDFLNIRKPFLLFSGLGLFYLSFYPSNEKVIALCVLLVLLLFISRLLRNKSACLKLVLLVIIIASVASAGIYFIQKKGGEEFWARADILVNSIGVENIGPINAWPIAWREISNSSNSLITGVGAGQYGWIAAGRGLNEGNGTKHSRQFSPEFEVDSVNNSGFLYRTNTWSSLLAEFGIIGFVLFLTPLILIVKRVKEYACSSRLEANLKTAFFVIVIMVVFQGFFTPYSNWSTAMLVFPMMYLAAYFIRKPESKISEKIIFIPN